MQTSPRLLRDPTLDDDHEIPIAARQMRVGWKPWDRLHECVANPGYVLGGARIRREFDDLHALTRPAATQFVRDIGPIPL